MQSQVNLFCVMFVTELGDLKWHKCLDENQSASSMELFNVNIASICRGVLGPSYISKEMLSTSVTTKFCSLVLWRPMRL